MFTLILYIPTSHTYIYSVTAKKNLKAKVTKVKLKLWSYAAGATLIYDKVNIPTTNGTNASAKGGK